MHFDLIDQPWMPVHRFGKPLLVSLREALVEAHELDELAPPRPTLVPAVLRQVLLPIVIDAFDIPTSEVDWAERWRAGQFDAPQIEGYLDRHRDRFDLFHPEQPFAQVRGLETTKGETKPSVVEKPRPEAVPTDLINAGVYRFQPSVFDAIRETPTDATGEVPLTGTIERLIDAEGVGAVRYRNRWLDVTHLWDVLHVNAAVLDGEGEEIGDGDRSSGDGDSTSANGACLADEIVVGSDVRIGANATIGRGTAIADNASIGANTTVENTVVMADARIGAGGVVRDAVIGQSATLGANATVAGGEATVVVNATVHEGVELGAVVGDGATVRGGATLAPGTVIGDGATVGDGCTVAGRVSPGAEVQRG